MTPEERARAARLHAGCEIWVGGNRQCGEPIAASFDDRISTSDILVCERHELALRARRDYQAEAVEYERIAAGLQAEGDGDRAQYWRGRARDTRARED